MPHILRVPQKQRGISSGGCGYVIAIIFERSDRDLCGPHPTACMGGPRRAPLTNARQRGINRSIGGPYYARGQLSLSSSHSRFLPSQRVFPNSTIDERHPSTATLTCIATPHDGSSSRVLFRQGHRAERRGWRCAEVRTITTTITTTHCCCRVRKPHFLHHQQRQQHTWPATSRLPATATDGRCRSRKWSQAAGNIEDLGKPTITMHNAQQPTSTTTTITLHAFAMGSDTFMSDEYTALQKYISTYRDPKLAAAEAGEEEDQKPKKSWQVRRHLP